MEIRGAREAELAEVIALQCQVFRPDGHTRFWRYVREDASFHLDQLRVVVVDGRIAATLRVWERVMRVGSCPLPLGGIGGVCTHPDFRGAGYAKAMMQEVVAYMRASGYAASVLFSIIGGEFYRRLGWASVPLAGFRLKYQAIGTNEKQIQTRIGEARIDPRRNSDPRFLNPRLYSHPSQSQHHNLLPTAWTVTPFDEGRDLAQVMALYAACNAQQSGSLVRNQLYWASAPARYRGVLPVVVARQGARLGGYLNFQCNEQEALVLEAAYDPQEPSALYALAHHLLQVCEAQQITEIIGDFSPRHPLVHLLQHGAVGDLSLTGNSAMMLYALDLPTIFHRILPDLQARLDASGRTFAPVAISFAVNAQQVVLRLDGTGMLHVVETDPQALPLHLPGDCFWSALLGESGWGQLEPTLRLYGNAVTAELSALLAILFPQQEVIFWGPDHF